MINIKLTRQFLALLTLCLSLAFCTNLNAAIKAKEIFSDQEREIQAGEKGSIVLFLSSNCPCSNSHMDLIKKLAKDHKEYNFVAVLSGSDEVKQNAISYFKNQNLNFPVLRDRDASIADKFKAARTPHAILMDKNEKILFSGGITESSNGIEAKENYLEKAIMQISQGKEVSTTAVRTLGCYLMREKSNAW